MTRIDASQVEGLPAASGGGYPMAIARDVQAAGVALAGAPDDTWYQRGLNNLYQTNGLGATLSSNTLNLPPGTYLVDWLIKYPPCRQVQAGVRNGSGDWVMEGCTQDETGLDSRKLQMGWRGNLLTLATTTGLSLWVYHNYPISGYTATAQGNNLGDPYPYEKVYSEILAIKLA